MKAFRTLDLAIEFHDLVDKVTVTGHLREQLFRAREEALLSNCLRIIARMQDNFETRKD